jgi:hypothetical protein
MEPALQGLPPRGLAASSLLVYIEISEIINKAWLQPWGKGVL